MKADNDIGCLEDSMIPNPGPWFGVRQEVLDYLIITGKITPKGGMFPLLKTAEAIDEFNSSPLAGQPMWRLMALHRADTLWVAAQREDRRHRLVYFVDGVDAIKIGTSGSPAVRVKDMQTGCWQPLTLIGTLPGGEATEAEIHLMFSDLQIRGEWYRRDARILQFIDDHCSWRAAA